MSPELVFPPIVSSEYELRPSFQVALHGERSEPEIVAGQIINILKRNSGILGDSNFTIDGSKIYQDKVAEIGLPECHDPFELVAYSLAHDEDMMDALVDFTIAAACTYGEFGEATITAGNRRRNIDAKGNSWACHDNVSISRALYDALGGKSNSFDYTSRQAVLIAKHLMMRPFMSGAGLVTPGGLHFAQKASTVGKIRGYGHKSFHFRTDGMHGCRLEARSSDRNVNNAAAVMRVGSFALLAALLGTPLYNVLYKFGGSLPSVKNAQGLYNRVKLTPERTIEPTPGLRLAVDFERYLAEVCRDALPKYLEVPAAYQTIAGMWQQYCEDFNLILNGEDTIDLIADRSDMARKFGLVLNYVEKDPGKRTTTDDTAMKIDQVYDASIVTRRGDTVKRIDGPGVKDQRNEKLPCTPSAELVATARYTPPSTRAAKRVERLRSNGSLIRAKTDWHYTTHRYGDREIAVELKPNYKY